MRDTPFPTPHDPALAASTMLALSSTMERMPGIRWALVFGSLSRGEPFHDVDIAVMPEPGAFPSWRDWGSMVRDLEISLEGVGPVDVVDLTAVSPPVLYEIITQGRVLLDRSPDERAAWEADAALSWLDFLPTWEEQRRVRRLAEASGW